MDKLQLTTQTYDEICEVFADTSLGFSDRIDLFLGLVKKGGSILDAGCGPGMDAGYMGPVAEWRIFERFSSLNMVKLN